MTLLIKWFKNEKLVLVASHVLGIAAGVSSGRKIEKHLDQLLKFIVDHVQVQESDEKEPIESKRNTIIHFCLIAILELYKNKKVTNERLEVRWYFEVIDFGSLFNRIYGRFWSHIYCIL
jgi:hypothetical protein